MITFKPNLNKSLEESVRIITHYLKRPMDGGEEIPREEIQSVIDAVLSFKKITERNVNYDRIPTVCFPEHRDAMRLGSNEEAISKNGSIYIGKNHGQYQDAYRFSLVSLLAHESVHCLQYFKEIDNPSPKKKPELLTPSGVGNFQSEVIRFAKSGSKLTPDMERQANALTHIFESSYYGQAREIEAYDAQYDFDNKLFERLKKEPGMDDESLSAYMELHSKFFKKARLNSVRQKNSEQYKMGREVIDRYIDVLFDRLKECKKPNSSIMDKESYEVSCISSIIAGLHYSYDEGRAVAALQAVKDMPEGTFDQMSNKAMAYNGLITATEMSVTSDIMRSFGGLYSRLCVHSENGKKQPHGPANPSYSKEKFYETYGYLGESLLKKSFGYGDGK